MSLVCETIISEDELSQTQSHATNCDDEELDYEEEDIHNKANNESINENNSKVDHSTDNNSQQLEEDDDKDEGELEDDDELEEGEVKEDDDSDDGKNNSNNRKRITAPDSSDRINNNQNNNSNNNSANSVCRFFGRGQCTWGNACRFVHPTGGMLKRMPPIPPMPPMPPMPPHLPPHPPNRNRPHRDFYENPQVHGPHGPQQNQSSGSESAWERGLKQAKEMIVRASRRKEEEIDFEDKRFNLGVEDDTSRHSRNSRDSSASPVEDRDRYDDEYERRRRLAFESAPWNNEEPPNMRMRSAETYRDPWRRSKSPPSGPKFRQRPFGGGGAGVGGGGGGGGSRSGSKRSHSMSSISASGSDSSDFSGSEGSSFSESSRSNPSERSGGRKRFNRKIMEKKRDSIPPHDQRFNKKGVTNHNWNKNNAEPNRDEREYDSWSESLSESESISSYYSGSNSESDVSKDSEPQGRQRIPKRPLSNNKKEVSKQTSINRKSLDHSDGPPNKKNKISGKSSSNAPLSPLLPTNKNIKSESSQSVVEKSEPPKKSPIKMTFMKKHSTLKKDNTVAVKLNGGRDNEEDALIEENDDSLQMSPGLSPKNASKSISSSSSISQDALTPPQPLHTSSSSSSGGSSKHDKQSLSATVSRREELLQQLRAVEDAIARKRSKIN